jgi:hypothetical protein
MTPPEVFWQELQIRIFQTNLYHKKFSCNEFLEVGRKIFNHSVNYLKHHPLKVDTVKTTGIYYNKMLQCGIINCSHEQALVWFKNTITTVCGEDFQGWIKNEQVTTFVKIFVPPGFEDTSVADYLEVIHIMFETEATMGIPWEEVKFYTHHIRQTHIIIASIPPATFMQIKAQGTERSKGSGVWKTEGFLAPLKLTLAGPNDLKSSRSHTISRPKLTSPTTSTSTSPHTSPKPSPSPSPTPPSLPSPPPPPPSLPAKSLVKPADNGKDKVNEPFLSSAACHPWGRAWSRTRTS